VDKVPDADLLAPTIDSMLSAAHMPPRFLVVMGHWCDQLFDKGREHHITHQALMEIRENVEPWVLRPDPSECAAFHARSYCFCNM